MQFATVAFLAALSVSEVLASPTHGHAHAHRHKHQKKEYVYVSSPFLSM